MSPYIQIQPFKTLLKNSWELYRGNFTYLMSVFLPLYMVLVLLQIVQAQQFAVPMQQLALGGDLAGFYKIFLFFFVIMISLEVLLNIVLLKTIGELCKGNHGSLTAIYREAIKKYFLPLLWVSFLVGILVMLGLGLLIIPGLIFLAWYVLACPAAVMEDLRGWEALKRSKELGRGSYVRNLGILFLPLLILIPLVSMIQFWMLDPNEIHHVAGLGEILLSGLITALVTPYWHGLIILLYFDMKARKEGAVEPPVEGL